MVAQVQVGHHTRPEVLHHHVGYGDEFQEDSAALFYVQTNGQVGLVAVKLAVYKAKALFGGPGVADADDVRAEVGEYAPAQGAGPDPGHVDYADVA